MLRYVDDFLFISTEQERAGRFLRVMDDGALSHSFSFFPSPSLTPAPIPGIPEYGCNISAEKRLTNFDISLKDGEVVPPLKEGDGAPQLSLLVLKDTDTDSATTQTFLGAAWRSTRPRSRSASTRRSRWTRVRALSLPRALKGRS